MQGAAFVRPPRRGRARMFRSGMRRGPFFRLYPLSPHLRILARSHILKCPVLNPEERNGEKILVASGKGNLLGGYWDRASNTDGAGGES